LISWLLPSVLHISSERRESLLESPSDPLKIGAQLDRWFACSSAVTSACGGRHTFVRNVQPSAAQWIPRFQVTRRQEPATCYPHTI